MLLSHSTGYSPYYCLISSLKLHCRLSKIRNAVVEVFPGDEIPSLRSNANAKAKVDRLVDKLVDEGSCYIQSLNFGRGLRF